MNKRKLESLYLNHSSGRLVVKDRELPIFYTEEFDFYRCLVFKESFYEKTVYELHSGNLRMSDDKNRYSSLFPGIMVSYWSDSIETAIKEVKNRENSKDIITFWAYDDCTSTFPILDNEESLVIIDGRDIHFSTILEKNENGIELSEDEKDLLKRIIKANPDCLAYESKANPEHFNFLFFEKGFKKLAIREVTLKLGSRKGKNTNCIVCAELCDYIPFPKYYGGYFKPIAKVSIDDKYLLSEDYKEKMKNLEKSHKRREHKL